MSFNGPFLSGQQSQVYQDDRVHNDRGAHHYPQFNDRPLTSYTFRDFVTPNQHATMPIIGTVQSLESLDNTLSPGVFARRTLQSCNFSAYTPLAVALSAVCTKVGREPITERDLARLHRAPWFADFAKAIVKRHNFKGMTDLNLDNLTSESCLSEDHMVLLAEAFAASQDLSAIELGIVAITKKGVKAFHYPWSAACNGLTAWIVVDCRTDHPVYYGLGHGIVGQQNTVNEQRIGKEEELKEEEGDADNEDQEAPTTTPRKTAARVLAQQTPLRAGLSAKDILEKHTDNLQYNNILKVGLHYSNQEIAKKVAEDAVGNNKKISTSASGIVKRINTAVDFIEKEFDMDVGAFRTAYDTARKNNGIPIRGKDGVDDQILAANASDIRDAMAWIKAGGPRPAAAAAAATTPTPCHPGYAHASNVNRGPVVARPTYHIPQLDGAMYEPDHTRDYASGVQSIGSLMQYNDNNNEPDWASMIDDTLLDFDDSFN